MSFENTGQNSDPSNHPTEEKQKEMLAPMLAENMRKIVLDIDFFKALKEKYNEKFPGVQDPDRANDLKLSVSKSGYGTRLDDGTWEEGEHLYVGFQSSQGGEMSLTHFVPVAKRVDTQLGKELVAQDGFTADQAELVAGMVDELELARLSGQIPDLHPYDLNWIYIPDPANHFDS